jgi:hypothetical protein
MLRAIAASICATSVELAAQHVENESGRRQAGMLFQPAVQRLDRRRIAEQPIERFGQAAQHGVFEERLEQPPWPQIGPVHHELTVPPPGANRKPAAGRQWGAAPISRRFAEIAAATSAASRLRP